MRRGRIALQLRARRCEGVRAALVAGLASVACSKTPEPSAAAEPSRPIQQPELRWHEDDPEAALRAAHAEGRPLFVDLWAPWCHTCLSMKSFVLTRENVPALSQLVLLAVRFR